MRTTRYWGWFYKRRKWGLQPQRNAQRPEIILCNIALRLRLRLQHHFTAIVEPVWVSTHCVAAALALVTAFYGVCRISHSRTPLAQARERTAADSTNAVNGGRNNYLGYCDVKIMEKESQNWVPRCYEAMPVSMSTNLIH